jgi:hypothetical protein
MQLHEKQTVYDKKVVSNVHAESDELDDELDGELLELLELLELELLVDEHSTQTSGTPPRQTLIIC